MKTNTILFILVAILTIVVLIQNATLVVDSFLRWVQWRIPSRVLDLSALGPDVSWSIIKQVYVINPIQSKERMRNMTRQLSKLKIKFDRFDAVDYVDIQNEFDKSYPNPINLTSFLDPRQKADSRCFREYPSNYKSLYGCEERSVKIQSVAVTFSHMQVWLKSYDLVASGSKVDGPVLIFEDDVLFNKEILVVAPKLINYLNFHDPDWAILGLGYSANHMPTRVIPYLLDKDMGFGCLHAYVFKNAATAKHFFDYYNTRNVVLVDHFWWNLVQSGKYNSYVYAPNDLTTQLRFRSNYKSDTFIARRLRLK